MKYRVCVAVLALVAASSVACSQWARKPRYGSLQSDSRKFSFEHGIELLRVKNGMKVALLRDERTNLVTVDVRYQVGSAEDPKGRAGMAHLVEHLVFLARSAKDGPTIGDLLADKALYYNAWTSPDDTHYLSVALADQLTAVLSLEATRMRIACDDIPDALFERERDVVLREEAERRTVYDDVRAEIFRAVWGKGHAYARAPGSREIATATKAEACAFVEEHYSPDRAILIATGNLDVDSASSTIAKLFGPIQAHTTAPRAVIPDAVLDGTSSQHVADIEEATAMIFFPAPKWGGEGVAPWGVVIAYLQRELVELEDSNAWITGIDVRVSGGRRARATTVLVSVDDPAKLDRAVKLVYEKATGLGERWDWMMFPALVAQQRTTTMGQWDDFMTRPSWLADYLQYTDDSWFFLRELAALDRLKANELQTYAKRYLNREHSHVALVKPSGEEPHDDRLTIDTTRRQHDVQPWRAPVDPEEATRPLDTRGASRVAAPIREEVLDNGLRVLLAPDPGNPVIDARVVFPVGTAADPDGQHGLALLAATMLDHDLESTYERADVMRLEWVLGLGTQTSAQLDERSTTFAARGLSVFADWHVWRLFWLLDQGVYDPDALAALRRRAEKLDDDEVDVRSTALRARLFGEGHPYARSRSVKELAAIDRGAIEAFRNEHYRARGATLIVVGGFDVDAMEREIRELFGPWRGDAPPARAVVPPVRPAKGPSWIAVRDPDQAVPRVTIAFATGSDPERDRAARLVLQEMIQDRVRVAREGMAATYNVDVGYASGTGGGELFVDTFVDPALLSKVLTELTAELAALRDGAGDAAEDFVRARRRAFADQLADAAGASDLGVELDFIASNDLPVAYYAKLAEKVAAVTPEEIAALAKTDLAERRMVVVVSGRAPVVTGAFAAAGITAEVLDAQ